MLSSLRPGTPQAIERLVLAIEAEELPLSESAAVLTSAKADLRHRKTKGSASPMACLTIVFKLKESTSKIWLALNSSALARDVIASVEFADGVTKQTASSSGYALDWGIFPMRVEINHRASLGGSLPK